MKATLLQTDIQWADPLSNREHLQEMIRSLQGGSDLIVLPEMFSTGFATTPEGIAEDAPSPSLTWMHKISEETSSALCGSIAVHLGEGDYRNRFYFVLPDGREFHYDKHHLFTYSGEHVHYTPGNERVIVTWKGVRFLLLVCYDLRFPVFSRNRGDYDAVIYVASWPSSRQGAWDTLLRARAIENQCYVLGVNRVGTDPKCSYDGGTVMVDPYGNVISGVPYKEEGVCEGNLDMEILEAFRAKFPVLSDSDPFTMP